jgi:DDE superfamily endonuclease
MDLPKQIIRVLGRFEGAFSERVWEWVKVLLVGVILTPGERTVAAILRVMGQQDEKQFQNYHRVLNRAKWSSREISHILLLLLVALFVKAQDPVVVGVDETIERRRGEQIEARGIYRDPVRSSKSVVVKTSGLRWISMMLLTQIPWAKRIWALPFLTVLAPSERYHEERKKRHKTITDWARQMVYQLHRWLPKRTLVIVGDGTYAALKFLAAVIRLPGVCVITPLRWDAALYDPAPERTSHTKGRRAKKGKRQPSLAQRLVDPTTVWQKLTVNWYGGVMREVEVATATAIWYRAGMPLVPIRWVIIRDPEGKFESRALLCTDQNADPVQIIGWFVLRWQVEVTFHEVRAHLGVETQRQWSDLAILRTTPALLGLFSLVAIFAHQLLGEQSFPVRQAAWYTKALPTFSDTLAFVRQHLWPASWTSMPSSNADMVEIPRALFERMVDTLAFTG